MLVQMQTPDYSSCDPLYKTKEKSIPVKGKEFN